MIDENNNNSRLVVYLSLGANLGQRKATLRHALAMLHDTTGIELARVSSFYETAPWGNLDQPPFINAAAMIYTILKPEELLLQCQAIEKELGRVRHEHWGARTIDIDLLCAPSFTCRTPSLTLPHQYLTARAFVLTPLAEIAPDLVIGEKTVNEHQKDCADSGAVRKVPGSPTDFCLKLIACVDKAWGIGFNGGLLFDMAADKEFFRRQTMGHRLIMGRRTWESLPGQKALPGRENFVLSRTLQSALGATICLTTEDLWAALAEPSAREKQNFVIGGGEIYRLLLPYIEEALITKVDRLQDADTFLPNLDRRDIFYGEAIGADGIVEFWRYRRLAEKKG
ncbi:MAG: 2-amino-4-hydroxy-6-hydroxymethyldihydropteridine diphosphokinase [Selenomonadaceae bacterium]|nr:2-amino-4-hydroxy-6-hydroxymethyldihydropteridine diphosphokinase [Selenomonadaceae bacterium]